MYRQLDLSGISVGLLSLYAGLVEWYVAIQHELPGVVLPVVPGTN